MSTDRARAVLRGRVVLVTGGSGFLGRSVVRRMLESDVSEVRVLTRSLTSEPTLTTGAARAPRFILGDLNDQEVVGQAIRGAHVVVHLAALKSIELSELNPLSAISTNVLGTSSLLRMASSEPTLERFVAISSDKASNPQGVYGLTKALMERLVAAAYQQNGPDFGSVRLGGIWGSPDSVLDRWQSAARTGAALSITDPEMTRFLMRRSEAIELIFEALSRDLGGGVMCRVMSAYAVGDLAAVISETHGLATVVTGRRAGEKLHEDLVSTTEAPFTERDNSWFMIQLGRRAAGTEPFSSKNARRVTQLELRTLVNGASEESA